MASKQNFIWNTIYARVMASVLLKLDKFYSEAPIVSIIVMHPRTEHIFYISVSTLDAPLAWWVPWFSMNHDQLRPYNFELFNYLGGELTTIVALQNMRRSK